MKPAAYILCATPRSGSTLLCDLLTGTGVAGAPNSFYRQLSLADWIRDWGITEPQDSPDFDRVFLTRTLEAGSAGTGMFGLRLMWNGVEDMLASLRGLYPGHTSDAATIDAAFGPTRYLYLSRTDKVAQAISRYRAEAGGLWHVNADGSEREQTKRAQVSYDRAAIAAYLAEVEQDGRNWDDWFARNGITPFQVTYENLAAHTVAILMGVLAALGLDPDLAKSVEARTRRLADTESLDWAARFGAGHDQN